MPTERPAKPERRVQTILVPRELAVRLKVISSHLGVTMTDALERLAGPAVTREYKRVIEELNRQFAAELGGES